MSVLRTLLTLSRVANLPTIWSNCLAGWCLAGPRHADHLPWVFSGATLLYLGGAFLNDTFDADFDRKHSPKRPIPSGATTLKRVWSWALVCLVLGSLILFGASPPSGGLGLTLVFFIVLFNALHKLTPYSPAVLGVCRLMLYLIGASAGAYGLTGWAIWCGLAMAAYTAGIGCLARPEIAFGRNRHWPVCLLVAPIVLALLMDTEEYREAGLLISAVLGLWILRSLRPLFWSTERNLARAVAGLSAGIVMVDWLAVGPGVPRQLNFIFLALFAAVLLLQKTVPAQPA